MLMQYVIVSLGGKQYKVREGDVIEIDRIEAEKDTDIILDKVLLSVSDDEVKIGKPSLPIKVKAIVLEHTKGEKIRVGKFKAKVRYRRATGFRPSFTKIRIEDIKTVTSK